MTLITNKIEHCDVGARFEALDALIFMVPSVLSCIRKERLCGCSLLTQYCWMCLNVIKSNNEIKVCLNAACENR